MQQTRSLGSSPVDAHSSPLLTDLYQLTMLQAYWAEGMQETAVFELFVRKLPERRNFLVAAGLEQALEFLEAFRFSAEELAWLERETRLERSFLDWLAELRFSGDVDALPEGTVFFPNEPMLRVAAPMPQAQLVESRLLNIVHFQSLIASKAARSVLVAPGKLLVDFGMRRAHGAEAALLAARAAWLAGFSGTATALAGMRYSIPVFGTMAHSFVQAHASEAEAFLAFARARPDNVILLIDTYDTEAAARKVIDIAPRLAREGIEIRGVRLDSGDLAAHAHAVRAILDAGGLRSATIFSSGNLDEYRVRDLLAAGAPIDGFGIGTSLDTSSDAPSIDAVYKLQEYAGLARRKRSEGKATWPGRKQVFRRCGADGELERDIVTVLGDLQPGTPLLVPVMRSGKRLAPAEPLTAARARAARELAALPAPLRALDTAAQPFPVEISPALHALAAEVDRRTA
jgi:nicotinate phosphoribosyltransferase